MAARDAEMCDAEAEAEAEVEAEAARVHAHVPAGPPCDADAR